jgi:hypothetical protein
MAKMPSKMSIIREPSKCWRKNVLMLFIFVSADLGTWKVFPLDVVLNEDHKS